MVSLIIKVNKILTFLILTIVFLAVAIIIVFNFKTKNIIPEKYLKSMGYEIEYIDEKVVNIPNNFGEGLKIISRYRERAKKILPDSDSRAKFWQNVFTEDLWRDLKSGELKNLEAKVENAFESFGAELQNDTGGNS